MTEHSNIARNPQHLTAEELEELLSGLDDLEDDARQVEAPPVPSDADLAANFLGPVPAVGELWFAEPFVADRAKRSASIQAAQARIATYQKQNKADLNRAWAEENQRKRDEQEAWRKTPEGRASEATRKREAYGATIAATEGREVREYLPATRERRSQQNATAKARHIANMTEAEKAIARTENAARMRAKRAEAKAAKFAPSAP